MSQHPPPGSRETFPGSFELPRVFFVQGLQHLYRDSLSDDQLGAIPVRAISIQLIFRGKNQTAAVGRCQLKFLGDVHGFIR